MTFPSSLHIPLWAFPAAVSDGDFWDIELRERRALSLRELEMLLAIRLVPIECTGQTPKDLLTSPCR